MRALQNEFTYRFLCGVRRIGHVEPPQCETTNSVPVLRDGARLAVPERAEREIRTLPIRRMGEGSGCGRINAILNAKSHRMGGLQVRSKTIC